MSKQLAMALALATGALAAQAAAPYQAQAKAYMERQQANPMRYARQPKSASAIDLAAMAEAKGQRNVTPTKQLPVCDLYTILEGPNGEVWTCTYDYDIEKVQHEYYVETVYKGVTLSVFNENFELLGTVTDHFELGEGISGVAQIMVDPVVTQKFFNYDSSYEIALMVSYNTPEYVNINKTYIYSIGATADSEGNTPRIAEYDGYIVASVNAATNKWSEDFYITFVTESGYDDNATTLEEFVASQKYIAKTYKKASWGGEPSVIGEVAISVANLPGDMMSCPFQLSTVINGTPTFVIQQYEKWFFNNAIGPIGDGSDGDEGMPTLDNHLVVDVYTYPGFGAEWLLDHTTKVACIETDDISDVVFRYYGIGNLTYTEDYRPDGSLRMSIYKYRLSNDDSYLQTYEIYNKEGEYVATLADNADNYILMSDVPGLESQAMFIYLNSPLAVENNAEASFEFVNLDSADHVLEIPSTLNTFDLKANVDRVPYGSSYRYAFETGNASVDEDFNVWEKILWLDAAGKVVRVDPINLGERVAIAKVYLDQSVLNPYLFNTDDTQEYLWLVKRYLNINESTSITQLMISAAGGETLLTLGPDADKGELRTISPIDTDTSNPMLFVSYYNDATEQYCVDFYSLPFNTLKGAGTDADPYLISTMGDFILISKHLNGSYLITEDIDASQGLFSSIPGDFAGKLDGAGHAISNLTVTGKGSIFTSLIHKAEIRNLHINNVTLYSDANNVGTLAGTASGATIDNVHITGLSINSDASITFGGIVGGAYSYSTISNSSVSAAKIEVPNGSDIGGIVGDLRTGSNVSISSFAGSIHGGIYVGGIVGSMNSDNTISDCHADADIVAVNTVGGIAGYFNSGLIIRCYVEGSIEAVGNPNASYDFGPAAGGILGYLNPDSSVLSATDVKPVVKDNLVALTSLKGYTPKAINSTTATMHRIVGRTIANEPVEDGNTWGADPRLANNYVQSTLAVIDTAIAPEPNTTEGASVDPADLTQAWFKNTLGFEYGEIAAWDESTEADPALNHEQLNVCVPAKLTVEANTTFLISVVLAGREIYTEQTALEQFSFDCDEQMLAPTGVFQLTGANVLAVEFESYKTGTTVVTLCGAKCEVTITENLGVAEAVIGTDSPEIAFDGTTLTTAGQQITVYSLQGIAVATGNGSLSVADLNTGIYVAVAGNGTLKFIVR